MDISEYLREPMFAALFAAAVTIGYVYMKAKLNKTEVRTSDYTKPAVLVAVLVYFVVSSGIATRETISTEPF